MNALAGSLRAEIEKHGPLSFREFMARALYDPAHGYYGSGKARVGREGDFFTNVSVGPLFGQLLARQFAEMWRRLGEPADFTLVEQGAHRGECAGDVLAGLREFDPRCFAATTLWIVEPYPSWRGFQQRRLHEFLPGKVRWASSLDELPAFRGAHYSNELLDAFPVHRVCLREAGWVERGVACRGAEFFFADMALSSEELRRHLTLLPPVPVGYETEVNLALEPWLHEVSTKLTSGWILAIDYGYPREEFYRPERSQGTLSAYAAQQRALDPLARPGEIDLTAHVDFTTVAECAHALGLTLAGFVDQHHLMVGLSRLHFPDDQSLAALGQKSLRAFQTLMHPGLLGRSFHGLLLSRNVDTPSLTAFQFGGDARAKLLPGPL